MILGTGGEGAELKFHSNFYFVFYETILIYVVKKCIEPNNKFSYTLWVSYYFNQHHHNTKARLNTPLQYKDILMKGVL